ncbi:MAG: hypothetical protein D3926_05415 [Desulfobacteraceae bacterium]|nr:MAG: hypothetical protein D3926_05415 [Desulfobacteraceae bacterium]
MSKQTFGDPFGMENLMNSWARSATAAACSVEEFLKQVNQSTPRADGPGPFSSFEHQKENPFHIWQNLYETEFKKYFKVPQLGLTREYLERINLMMDQFHQFQANYSEFIGLLSQPFYQSMENMHQKMSTLAESGELPDDPEEYYRIWIKLLEEHFANLFQTPEYVEALSKTMGALSSFSQAKDTVIEDLIKDLPVARQSEVDDLAREVYELKRRIKRLEKQAEVKIEAGEVNEAL